MGSVLLVVGFFLFLFVLPVFMILGLIKPAWLTLKLGQKTLLYDSRKMIFKHFLAAELISFVLMYFGSELTPEAPKTADQIAPLVSPAVARQELNITSLTDSLMAEVTPVPSLTYEPTALPTNRPILRPTLKPTNPPEPTSVPVQQFYTAPATSHSCTGPDLDCSDFGSHAEAQAFFESCGWSTTNDPMRLDSARGEGNGIACESL